MLIAFFAVLALLGLALIYAGINAAAYKEVQALLEQSLKREEIYESQIHARLVQVDE